MLGLTLQRLRVADEGVCLDRTVIILKFSLALPCGFHTANHPFNEYMIENDEDLVGWRWCSDHLREPFSQYHDFVW